MELVSRKLKNTKWMTRVMHGIVGTPMIMGLAYHGTNAKMKNGIDNIYGKHIDADTLEKHLRYTRANFNVISLSLLVKLLLNGDKIPRNSLFITFDDGYIRNFNIAYPLLRKYKLCATFFVPTFFIESGLSLPIDTLDAAVKYTRKSVVEIPLNKKN